MKIALVCPYNMFEHHGGVQQVVVHLREGLVAKGHDAKIITPRPAGFKGEVPEGTLLLGTSTKFNAGLATTGTWTFDVDSKEVKALMKKEHFDVINFHEPWAPILARQMLPYSTAAHVGTFHANFGDSMTAKSIVNMFKPYGRGIGIKMHVLTAVSSASAKVLLEKGLEEHKDLQKTIRIIPNGIDLRAFRPAKHHNSLNGAGTLTILYVGRLERRKGVEYLVRAFEELVKTMPKTHLMIAGEGGRETRLKQMVRISKIPNVHFLGYVDEKEKIRLMQNADLFCSPAMFGESFGIVLIESMAVGTPLVAGRNTGYINVMKGFGRLSLVDADATADFAERMELILTDQDLRRLWRRWARLDVRQYNYRHIVDMYEKAYNEALQIKQTRDNGQKAANEKPEPKTVRRFFIRRQSRP